jgi:hypothetical protein
MTRTERVAYRLNAWLFDCSGVMMSMYAIEAVRINADSGRIEQVRWGRIDPAHNTWETEPFISDVNEVVDKLMDGDEVWTAFSVANLSVLGSKVRVVVHEDGSEGIETVDPANHAGRTLHDLPAF